MFVSVSRALALILLILTTGLLAACGDSEKEAAVTTATGTTAGAFPATVRHKFGTTTVPAAPQRIVSVGLTEHDTLLALGARPIAITEWYGDQPDGVWPWARAAMGDARPEILHNADGFEFERIAALKPDLIVGTNSGMRQADYDKLSALAPTIAAGAGSTDYFSPWDEQVELIAQALGEPAGGSRLVADVRRQFADAAAAHPELKGKTISFSQNGFYDGLIYSYPDGLNTEFLTYLGLRIEPRVTALAGRRGEQVPISAERLDVLDSDIALFATERARDVAALLKVPTFRALRAVQGDHAVYSDGTLAGAMYFMTPLSLQYVVERLPQELARAAAGRAPQELVGGA
ncbi:ABC transporter substrate-binding protein [Conexibacter sp. JD483]|uniref:ABC transporter substrate-binding protein n=1 Tax=unclassified Conexibacter TaxID=2627773 RepID=UPI0027271767|nr:MULTISPECIES: ABC transporter substrate-binding protein [unclassified Conexibacter]MDO8188339.1 ABC transporter substrate-binding protein [Conexibacter sp. CPCC 205706]MDO8200713.1 ABC transporter substrate-binding protein [Conexibacter sp. CPCC 205762]MDR9369437.1 ABC transporter substrate-binding protein [Conexibacter sp. JD483]